MMKTDPVFTLFINKRIKEWKKYIFQKKNDISYTLTKYLLRIVIKKIFMLIIPLSMCQSVRQQI